MLIVIEVKFGEVVCWVSVLVDEDLLCFSGSYDFVIIVVLNLLLNVL